VARLVESSRTPIEYARTGTLEVALDDDDAARLLGTKVWLDTTGIDSEWLDGDAVRVFEPSVTPAALGGLFTPDHGLVGVSALMATLVQQAKHAGAVFEFPVQAAVLEQRHNRVDIVAGERRYEADAVVVAAGSWSRRVRVIGGGGLPVKPVRGQLLHLQWCEGDQPGRIVWGPHCYAVPWSNGGVLIGATVEDAGFDEGTTVSGVQALSTAAVELLPHASGARLEAIRVGLRPSLPDGLPAIGPFSHAPRIVAATGHYRSGVLLAPLTAEIVSRYLLEGRDDPSFAVTSPDRLGGL
jgi:glycine oxidase